MPENHNGKCKTRRSPYRKKIDELILEGVSSTKIIKEFPELNLNRTNIHNHKNHITLLQNTNDRVNKTIDSLNALDNVIAQSYNNLGKLNTLSPPRAVEVWSNLFLRAIRLKHEITEFKSIEERLEDLLNKIRR